MSLMDETRTDPHSAQTELINQIRTGLSLLQANGTQGFTRQEISDQITQMDDLRRSLDTALIPIFAAGRKERVFELDRARSDSTWLSSKTRRSRSSCASQFSRAQTLIEDLPDLYTALVDGRVGPDHVDAILAVHSCSREPSGFLEFAR